MIMIDREPLIFMIDDHKREKLTLHLIQSVTLQNLKGLSSLSAMRNAIHLDTICAMEAISLVVLDTKEEKLPYSIPLTL